MTYARVLSRAWVRFVRRYSYELGRCNSLNTARRSRAGGGEQRFGRGRRRRRQGYERLVGCVP